MAWDVGTNPAADYQLTLSEPRSLPLHVAEATVGWLWALLAFSVPVMLAVSLVRL